MYVGMGSYYLMFLRMLDSLFCCSEFGLLEMLGCGSVLVICLVILLA